MLSIFKWIIFISVNLFFVLHAGAKAQAFSHPGLLNTQAELDLMKRKVNAGEQPWLSGYQKLDDWFQDLTNRGYPTTPGTGVNRYENYQPLVLGYTFKKSDGTTEIRPRITKICDGRYTEGDSQELMWDARAAYASALHWIVTGNATYANKAVEIIDAWSSNVTDACYGYTRLIIAGSLQQLIYAAEIMRATYTDVWGTDKQNNFKRLLTDIMYIHMVTPNRNIAECGYTSESGNNNWGVMASATRMTIAIFTDSQELFDNMVMDYKFYIEKDFKPFGKYLETCRGDDWHGDWLGTIGCDKTNGGDLAHTQMTLQALTAMAEMAKKQGVDLYGYADPKDGNSLLTTLLYHAPFMGYGNPPRIGFDATNWPCDKPLSDPKTDTNRHVAFWEMAYNHYRDQDPGQKLKSLIDNWARPEGNMAWSDVGWGTLTHNYAGAIFAAQDVNEDSHVNIRDIQEVIRCIININSCAFPGRSDVNGDGSVNIKDIQEIIRKIITP